MALREQGERTYQAKSAAATDPSPCLRGSEEEHHRITHTQFEVHTNTATKPPGTHKCNNSVLLSSKHNIKWRAANNKSYFA